MRNPHTALIVGAGIGGLAAGLALRRAGWTVRIHECAVSPRELGFGVLLARNALSALRELGVAEGIVRVGVPTARIEIRRTSGRVIRRLNAQLGGPSVVALRPDLHGALLTAVGDEAMRLNSEAVSFSGSAAGITLRLKDGYTDTGSVLIGADGVNSAIRRCLHPTESPARLSGFCTVRGVAYGVTDYLGDLSAVGYLDDGIEAATVRASGNAVYWYLSLLSDDIAVEPPTPKAILDERLAGFEPALRAILSATNADDMRFDQLLERDALRTWGAGHVTLLGDAAHPLLPHTGQGAAQALEDAVALGLAVTGPGSVEQALRRYEDVRNALIKMVRLLAVRLLPERVLAWSTVSLQRDPHRELRLRLAA